MTPLTPAELRAALEASPLSPALADEVMATVEAETELCGQVVIASAFDVARIDHYNATHGVCSFCGDVCARDTEAMRTHMLACAKHPMAAERAAHESTLEEARRISIALMRERDAERAKVARLREALIAVRDAMTATDQHPDATGPDWSDPRRPLASMVWRVLADTAPDSPNTPEVSR